MYSFRHKNALETNEANKKCICKLKEEIKPKANGNRIQRHKE